MGMELAHPRSTSFERIGSHGTELGLNEPKLLGAAFAASDTFPPDARHANAS